MKIIFCALVLATTSLYAQTAKDVVKQLNGLQGINTLDPVCETCEASQVPALTPQEAIKAINSGKLVYIGRELLAGHDQNRSCVYKSDTAYIIYHNCMGSKKESEATISLKINNIIILHFNTCTLYKNELEGTVAPLPVRPRMTVRYVRINSVANKTKLRG